MPAKKAAGTSISTEENRDHASKSLSIAIPMSRRSTRARCAPGVTTIRDLLSRMHLNKLGIMRGAKPMLTNMLVNQRSGKVEYEVASEHGTELPSFVLTGLRLAVQVARSKLTDGMNAPWRFKKYGGSQQHPSNSRIGPRELPREGSRSQV